MTVNDKAGPCWVTSFCIVVNVEPGSPFLLDDPAFFLPNPSVLESPLCQCSGPIQMNEEAFPMKGRLSKHGLTKV